MNAEKYVPNDLRKLLLKNKIDTLDELKAALKTKSTMTVFRKLKQLEYISSYSHRGKYYSLNEIAEYDPYPKRHFSVGFQFPGALSRAMWCSAFRRRYDPLLHLFCPD